MNCDNPLDGCSSKNADNVKPIVTRDRISDKTVTQDEDFRLNPKSSAALDFGGGLSNNRKFHVNHRLNPTNFVYTSKMGPSAFSDYRPEEKGETTRMGSEAERLKENRPGTGARVVDDDARMGAPGGIPALWHASRGMA